MSTLKELEEARALTRFDPELRARELPERRIYMLPRAVGWAEEKLPALQSVWQIDETPAEQLDAILAEFCAGEPLAAGEDFKCLHPIEDGIWELKTADLRVFGWFYRKETFIWSAACLTDVVKDSDLYFGFVKQAARDRDLLDLDPPKFVPGENPNDVVSAWY
jgi:hypothetical protein